MVTNLFYMYKKIVQFERCAVFFYRAEAYVKIKKKFMENTTRNNMRLFTGIFFDEHL